MSGILQNMEGYAHSTTRFDRCGLYYSLVEKCVVATIRQRSDGKHVWRPSRPNTVAKVTTSPGSELINAFPPLSTTTLTPRNH